MACNCISTVNAYLSPKNSEVATTFKIKPFTHQVVIVRTDRLKAMGPKAVTVAAPFCPFCGTRYASDDAGDAEPTAPLDSAAAEGLLA